MLKKSRSKKSCLVCATEFVTRNKNQSYCCAVCRFKAEGKLWDVKYQDIRFAVFARDKFRCFYCGASSETVKLEIDHVLPVCEGGNNNAENLVTSCHECNSSKSHKVLSAELIDSIWKSVLLRSTEELRLLIQQWERSAKCPRKSVFHKINS